MAEVQIQYKQFHDQEWELRRREEEIDSLRNALADAQLHIFDEREHSMHLQHQNDALKSMYIGNLHLTHNSPGNRGQKKD